jgi:signal transduction histidine kinase
MQDIAPFGVFATDTELRIRSWNQWLTTHSGLAAETVLGRPLFEIYPDLVERGLSERFTRAIAGEVSVLSTALHQYLLPLPVSVPESGLPHMLQTVRIAPLPAGGTIVGTITILEDVTQREYQAGILQRQQEIDRLLSAALAALLQSTDPARDVAEILPAITPLLGIDAFLNYGYDASIQTFQLTAAGGISPKQREFLNDYLLSPSDTDEHGVVAVDLPVTIANHQRALHQTGLRGAFSYPLVVGERVVGLLSFGRYIDDEVLPAYLQLLARIAGFVAIALDRASRERDTLAASRAKDDFLAALSHELRTPLNPVLLIASDSAANPEYSQAAREAFRVIEKNAQLEARLIDDLLDLTRIEHGKLSLEIQSFDVHATLRDALANIQGDAADRQIRVEVALDAEDSIISGDSGRLQQVFWNVLKNAIKFTPPSGVVRVTTRYLATTREIQIAVIDSGIGLEPHEIGRIFGAFKQGDHAEQSRGHRFGGLGLGLAISRKLVEMHTGKISATSLGRNRGSTFTITLPLEPIGKEENLSEPRGDHAAARKAFNGTNSIAGRILLVEDHEPTRAPLTRLLKRRGYEVVAVGTATAARAAAAENVFDVVLSDIGLPDGDGLALMRFLREDHGIIGVALTGYGMEEDLARSSDAGFVDHLTKPISVVVLDRTLAKIFSRSEVK